MKIVAVIVQLAITAAVLIFLSHKLDFNSVYRIVTNASAFSIVTAAALYALQFAVTSFRLRFALRILGAQCSFLTALRSILAGAFFAQTPLSNFGGDMVRVWTIFRDGVSLRNAASAVTLDRLFGFISLVALILLTLPVLWIHVSNPHLRLGIAMVLAAFATGVVAFLLLQRMPATIRTRFSFADWVGQVSAEFHMMVVNKKTSASIIAMGLCAHFLSLGIFYAFARDVGMNVGFFQVLYLTPFPLLVSLLPISIGGWGVREGAMIAAFGLVGVPADKTLSASILFGILSLLVALPGALVWLHAQFAWSARERAAAQGLTAAQPQPKGLADG